METSQTFPLGLLNPILILSNRNTLGLLPVLLLLEMSDLLLGLLLGICILLIQCHPKEVWDLQVM